MLLILPLLGLFALITLGTVLIIYGSVTKNRMGININFPKACPVCNTPFPTLRKPASPKQALWGGTTCKNCGSEFDKRGRKL